MDAGADAAVLARPGLPLGRARPGRFEPAQALATSLDPGTAAMAVHWDADDPALGAYLSGAPVADDGPDGWVLVCWRRSPLGWARRSAGVLKNLLPDHVRRMVTP
jgi:NOL1/NOP2/fmu family ribosome biogenesis protein